MITVDLLIIINAKSFLLGYGHPSFLFGFLVNRKLFFDLELVVRKRSYELLCCCCCY